MKKMPGMKTITKGRTEEYENPLIEAMKGGGNNINNVLNYFLLPTQIMF